MGQFEKIVVLAVLFIITVIVVASFSPSEEDPGTSPLAGLESPFREPAQPRGTLPGAQLPLGTEEVARRPEFAFEPSTATEGAAAPAGQVPAPRAEIDPLGQDLVAPTPAAEGSRAGQSPLLLSTEVADPGAPPAGLPTGTLLRTAAGLEQTPHPDFMSYVPRSGDSFSALAERFYGTASRVALLRQANEGRRELRAGEQILIPIFDLARQEPQRPLATGPLPSTSGAQSYEVQAGESLWAISQKHYGTGTRWQAIFEANQDVLRDADSVRAGMRLRIP